MMVLDDPDVLAALAEAVDRLREHKSLKERIVELERRQRDNECYISAATGVVHAARKLKSADANLLAALNHYDNETEMGW